MFPLVVTISVHLRVIIVVLRSCSTIINIYTKSTFNQSCQLSCKPPTETTTTNQSAGLVPCDLSQSNVCNSTNRLISKACNKLCLSVGLSSAGDPLS